MSEQTARIDTYLQENWEQMVASLDALVSIESYRDDAQANEEAGAPYGPGPRAALTAILSLAESMGFETTDLNGYIGWADYPAAEDAENPRQIGIIGHVDVVPAGPGWDFPPYRVSREQGFLLGRGVIDDKGPVLMALYALKFWKDQGVHFPFSVRFLFGAAEETGMEDVEHYRSQYADPDFLFTPDAEFPVSYGEKGHYDGELVSPRFVNGNILSFEGGTAANAVPGSACATFRCSKDSAAKLPAADRLTITPLDDDTLRIEAAGRCQHASTPEGGINAIGLIVDYALANSLCSEEERAFLEIEQRLLNCTDGSGFDCACSDEDFGALTMVGGVITFADGRITQTIDARYPTSMTASEITARIAAYAQQAHATANCLGDMPTFLVDPHSPEIQALCQAYNAATGEHAEPFTMGGGTYARKFTCAASFGPEKPWEETPSWVGGMHGPNEGVSEELLQQAFKIYALTLPLL